MKKFLPERKTSEFNFADSYTWKNYWPLPVLLLFSLLTGFALLYFSESGLRVDVLQTCSYWMELCGVLLIAAELIFGSKTESFLRNMEEIGDPQSPKFLGWAKWLGISFVSMILSAFVYEISPEFYIVNTESFMPAFFFACSIFYGLYYPLVAKRGDRIAATGISLAVTGMTFETSAMISIAFFN